MQCPQCQHDNPPGAKFCVECASPIERRCPACGAQAPPTAKFCPECAAPLTAKFPPAGPATRQSSAPTEAGERRQLTVLFCDLVGSTPLSQQLDAEEWRYLIAQYQQAASAAVARFGGHVAKNLGDGLLIYFGWPTAREDDPERAIRAGLAIVDAMAPLHATVDHGARLAVRIGLHTGAVVIADGGEVFGETANIAARVQGAAEPDTVMISATTQRLVAGMFVIEDRGPQELKGVREPVQLYRVVQPSGMRSRLDLAADRLTPFVGREMELGTLLDRWEQVTEGHGQNVLLSGEAGVGKSRLARELRARLASEPHTWLECRATPFTEATPFFPVIELLKQGLALERNDSTADRIAKLERGLAILSEPLAETLPVIARLLGIDVPVTYPQAQPVPEVERQRTLEILSAWNLALGEVQPLVLLVEDLHWCDATSLALLGRIVEQSATARVLLLGTARPEFAAPWPARSNLLTLSLARFTKRQAREMVHALGAALASETLEALVARGDGVPLYLEELTKAVAESGAGRSVEAIPATLADSLMARLDRLSTAKEVAQRAAVLGREFSYSMLAAIAELDESALRQGLARLVEAEILFVRGAPPAATYTFKHALVQEAAYESLLKRVRQQLHARVCDALAADGDGAQAPFEVLAHHAERAGRVDEAIDHLERAGVASQQRTAHGEAARHFERAIALLATHPESIERDAREVRLGYALGISYAAWTGYGSPIRRAVVDRTLMLAERVGDWRTWMIAAIFVAASDAYNGHHERSRVLTERVLHAPRADETERTLFASVQLAQLDYWQGEFHSSVRHAERALTEWKCWSGQDIRSVMDTDQFVVVSGFAAWSLGQIGRLDDALAHADQGVSHAERRGSPFDLAFGLCFAAITCFSCRDYAGERAHSIEAIKVSDRFGFPLWRGLSRFHHGCSRVSVGDADGLAEMLDGLSIASETGLQNGAAAMLGQLAEAQYRMGRLEDAQATLAAAKALASQLGERHWESELHTTDGEIACAMGRPLDDVLARFRRALSVARELGALRGELLAAMAMARTLRDAGHPADAYAELAPVYAKFTQGFGTPLLIEAKTLLEEI
jgi:class 3 adenylate cyclase/tetratricopeptide (TPR) repeat protein